MTTDNDNSAGQVDDAHADGKPCCPSADPSGAGPRAGGGKTLPLLLLVLLAGHVAVNIDPQILYQADEAYVSGRKVPTFPYYYQGAAFFKQFLDHPGGMAEYLGANVSQYFSMPRGGAIILVGLALIVFLAIDDLLLQMAGRKGHWARYLGPLILVVIWNRYTFLMADQLAMAASLVAACMYFRLPDRPAVRFAALIPAMAILYYAAAGPALLLGVVAGLYELLVKRRAIGLAYLLVAGLTPLAIGVWLFDLTASQAYLHLTGPQADTGVVPIVAWAGMYGLLIALPIGAALRVPLARSCREIADSLWERFGSLGTPHRRPLVGAILAVAVGATVAMGTIDSDVRAFRRICYYSQQQQWGKSLQYLPDYPVNKYTVYTCRMINRALYENGAMGDVMFAYPQTPAGGLLPRMEMDQPHKSDTLLKLGAVNRIEHLALESLEQWGPGLSFCDCWREYTLPKATCRRRGHS